MVRGRARRKEGKADNKLAKIVKKNNRRSTKGKSPISAKRESRIRNKADKLDERADILTGGKGNFKNRLLEIWGEKQKDPIKKIGSGIIRKYN